MQKKVLLSLLAAAPVAFTVSAHQNVSMNTLLSVDESAFKATDANGVAFWSLGGITPEKFDGNKVELQLSGDAITFNLASKWQAVNGAAMPKGKYQINFGDFDNCAMKINGVDFKNGEVYDYNGDGTFVITFSQSVMEGAMVIGNGSLSLQFNFDAEMERLFTEELNKVKIDSLTEQNPGSELYNSLKEEGDEYDGAVKKLEQDILSINPNEADLEGKDVEKYFLDKYIEYKLMDTPDNVLQQRINELLGKVNTYNEQVKAENERYATQNANQATLTDIQSRYDALKETVDLMAGVVEADPNLESVCGAALDALQTNMTNLQTKINDTFKDGDAVKSETIEPSAIEAINSQLATLEGDKDSLGDMIAETQKDIQAYKAWYAEYTKLGAAQKSAIEELNTKVENDEKLKDGLTQALNEYVAAIDTIVTNTKNSLKITEGQFLGASQFLEKDTKNIDKGIADINAKVEAFTNFVNGQNTAYEAAQADYEAVQGKLTDAIKSIDDALAAVPPTLNPDDADKLKAEGNAIQEQIDNMKSAIDGAYGKDLSAETYGKALEDINNAIETLNENIDTDKANKAIADTNSKHISDVEDALKKLKDSTNEWAKDTPFVNTFDSTFANMDKAVEDYVAAVEALKTSVEDDENLLAEEKYILDNIASVDSIVKQVQNEYASSIANLKSIETPLEAFKTAIAEKEVVKDANGTPLVDKNDPKYGGQNKVDEYQKKVDEFKSAFSKLTLNLNNYNNFLNDVENIGGQINAAKNTMPGEIAASQSAFLRNVSNANNEVASAAFKEADNLYKTITEEECPGKADAYTDLCNLSKARTQVKEALESADSTDETINAQDPKCQEIYDKSLKLFKDVQNIIANNTAYGKIMSEYNTAVDAIDSAREEIKDKTLQPAQDFFLAQLDKLAEEVGNHKTDADTAYQQMGYVAEGSENDMVSELIKDTNEANDIKTNAIDNEKYHAAQVKLLGALNDLIGDTAQKIWDSNKVESDRNIYLDRLINWKAEYEKVVNDVADAYANGNSKSENDGFVDEINRITEEVNKILDENNENYNEVVASYNAEQYANAWLNNWYDKLFAAWCDAVGTFNRYSKTITNKGYQEAIGNLISSHEDIKDYYDDIIDLQTAINAAIRTLNESNTVIDEQWLNEHINTPSQKILDNITTDVDDMTTKANAFAEQYYTEQHNAKMTLITDALNTMTNAGVSEERAEAAIQPALDKLKTAERSYEAGKAAGELSVYMGARDVTSDGVVFRGIADILDEITAASMGVDQAVKDQWESDYNAAAETLNGYYNNLTDEYTSLSEEERAGYKAQLDEMKKGIDTLNTNFNEKDAEGQLNSLKRYQENLASYLKTAKGIDKAANDKNEYKVAEKAAQEKFTGLLGGTDNSLEALKAWVNGMAIEPNRDYSAIESAIQKAKDYVASHTGSLSDSAVDAEAQSLIDAANTAIENAYNTFYADEIAALQELMKETKRNFNDWAAQADEEKWLEDPYKSVSDTIEGLVDTLVGNAAEDIEGLQNQEIADFESKEAAREALLNLQKAFCDTMVEIAGYAGQPNPAEGVLGELNAEYDEVAAQIAALEQLLDTCDDDVKAKYGETISNAKTALDNVKADYIADGNNIIATGDSFINEMEGISDSLNGLADSINADKTAHEASNAAAANLQTQLDELQAEFDKFKSFVEGCGMWNSNEEYKQMYEEQYAPMLADLQNDLNEMQQWLDSKKAAYALTADSTLPDAAQFTQNLDTELSTITRYESDYQINLAKNAISNVDKIIHEIPHANQADLEQKLADLKAKFEKLEPQGTIDTVLELTAEVKAIIADATALADEALENSFIWGDVNGDGDINGLDLDVLLDILSEMPSYDPEVVEHVRADINKDGKLTLQDALMLIRIINKEIPAEVRMKMAMASPAQAVETCIQAFEAVNNGTRVVDVYLTNHVDFVGGQFVLSLPEGMQIISEQLGERNEGMLLKSKDLSSTRHSVVFISNELKNIDGNEGIVLHLEVTGNSGDILVYDSSFVDAEGNLYYGTDPGTTGIDGIFDSMKDGAQRVYDAAGRMLNKVQQGINIVVGRDGKAEKIYRKR